jgi:diaminohydroxyphosphoribosylaminopyrimidine deaminase/5-amino-6-(5-phosphoribosylamino)uracil reductase
MTAFSDADRAHMARALALAANGLYTTTPNPRVGCVIVSGGEVIGEGWHERAGEAHAEINALEDVTARGKDARGATLYSTLEPCNHVGRTRPCAEAVIAAGVTRVVAAMADPNPEAAAAPRDCAPQASTSTSASPRARPASSTWASCRA